jgi:hypothetical protein
MAGEWSPEVEQLVIKIVTRALVRGSRKRLERLADDAEEGRPVLQSQRNAAIDFIKDFGQQATRDLIEFLQSTYGDVPPNVVDRVSELLRDRIGKMPTGLMNSLKESHQLQGVSARSAEERLTQAALLAQLDVELAFAPLKLRSTHVVKKDAAMTHGPVIYNVTGPNARVNVNSVDGSTNIVNVDAKQLFAKMHKALDDSSIDSPTKEVLRGQIVEMEAETGKNTFAQKYANFMAQAANHMAVFQPFFQALAQQLLG